MQKSYDSASLLERGIGKLHQHQARLVARTIRNMPDNNPVISICFDDFHATAPIGAEMLKKSDALGTFYTCFGLLNDCKPVQEIYAAGHEIACHTFNHLNASFNTPALFEKACNDNRKAAAELSLKPQHFAFPEGGMNLAAKQYVMQHYQSARSGFWGINKNKLDIFCLRSVPFYTNTLQAVHSLIGDIQEQGGWLILYTHDLTENPSKCGITPSDLQYLLTLLKAKNIPIRPVGEVVASLC